MVIWTAETESDTQKIAASFAKLLRPGDIVALEGTLGVGKTAFTRALVQSLLGADEEVPSPTFTLVQTYEAPLFTIHHFDLYRLEKPEEAYEMGIEESFIDGVNLIEWPEKLGRLLPQKKTLNIRITCKEDARTFEFSSNNPHWQERLNAWTNLT